MIYCTIRDMIHFGSEKCASIQKCGILSTLKVRCTFQLRSEECVSFEK